MKFSLFRGIQYLHRYKPDRPLIHGDIKPGNILLDEHCEPKIGDFGLSRVGPQQREYKELKVVFGTKPYLPPEFLTYKLFSTGVDVFSFGVVLFELATSLKSHDKGRSPEFLYEFMREVDDTKAGDIFDVMDKAPPRDMVCVMFCALMLELGKHCSNVSPSNRPNMEEVYQCLNNFEPNNVAMNIQGLHELYQHPELNRLE